MFVQYEITVVKKPDVTDLAGEKVMIDFDSGKYFMLTGSANDIWDLIVSGATTKQIVTNLMDLYEVDESTCYNGVIDFLKKLVDIEFITLREI